MSHDDELSDFHPATGHLRICAKTLQGSACLCNRDCHSRLYDVAVTLEKRLGYEQVARMGGGPPGPAYPECEGHNELQKRDGKPPWCSRCGWNRGQPARPAKKYGQGQADRVVAPPHLPWTPGGGYVSDGPFNG